MIFDIVMLSLVQIPCSWLSITIEKVPMKRLEGIDMVDLQSTNDYGLAYYKVSGSQASTCP